MQRLVAHVRNLLLVGTVAAVPVTVALFLLWYIDGRVRAALERARRPHLRRG
jgi:hypothetical protein